MKAEIESFKMVCNTSLGLFLAETKESPICGERERERMSGGGGEEKEEWMNWSHPRYSFFSCAKDTLKDSNWMRRRI